MVHPTAFPIQILYKDTKQVLVVKSPKEIRPNRSFKVLKTNVKG